MVQKVIIIGATSAIAQQCARIWVNRGPTHFVLIGRDMDKLNRVAQDLKVRGDSTECQVETCDFLDTEAIGALAKRLGEAGPIDTVLIAHGTLPDQKDCESNLLIAKEAMALNGLSPAYFAESFSQEMERTNSGNLVVIGSVAGDRGRQSNYVYGASKALVEKYVQGLRHRLSGSQVRVMLVKPGPTQTPMTAHMKGHERMASPERVASEILEGVDKGKSTIYSPGKWRFIMMIIRIMPELIFNKMKI